MSNQNRCDPPAFSGTSQGEPFIARNPKVSESAQEAGASSAP